MELVSVMVQNDNLHAKVKAIELIMQQLPPIENNDRFKANAERMMEALKRVSDRRKVG